MTPAGQVSIQGKLVYNYTGNQTFAPLLEGPDGSLYGTAMFGRYTFGTIYRLSFEIPSVTATRDGDQVVITWPQASLDLTGEFDYYAQFTTDLNDPRTWNYVTLANVLPEDGAESQERRFLYRQPATSPKRFYRLIRR